MEIVSVFLLFIEIFVSVVGSSKWLTGVYIFVSVCIFCQGNLCFGECQFAFLVQFFWFTGVFFAYNGYNLKGMNGFLPFC